MENKDYEIVYFEGDQLEYVDYIFKKYFDYTGFEFMELLQQNRSDYPETEEEKKLSDINFLKNKTIYIGYKKDVYIKLLALTLNDKNYLINDDKQDTIIWLLVIFYQYRLTNNIIFDAITDYEFCDFFEYVRPDMLRIFKSMHAFFTKEVAFDQIDQISHPIKIIYGNKEISLENEENWFFRHLKEYLDTYLKEKTIEEIETALKQYKPKLGAKSDHTVNRIITQLYHFLQEETPYHDPQGKKTDKICIFITRFLEILGFLTIVPEEEEFDIKKEDRKKKKTLKNWIATIRTKISENLKWEQENGPYKSAANEIFSHRAYKEVSPIKISRTSKYQPPKYW